MVLKAIVPVLVGAALIAGSAASASDYRPDQFLSLDLSKAVLSPTPLGPANTFQPVAVEAKGDSVSGVLAQNDAKKVAVEPVRAAKSASRHTGRLAEVRKPRGAARVHLAHRHGDPMNAEARDMRVQKWPCNPDMGGICAWRR